MKKSIRKTLSAAVAAAMCAGLAGAMPAAPVSAANGMGTYEVETFEGVDQVWTSIYENQLPGYYGDGFAYLTAAPISIEMCVQRRSSALRAECRPSPSMVSTTPTICPIFPNGQMSTSVYSVSKRV